MFSNLNIPIKVENESGLKQKLKFLVERTNENFKKFTLRSDMEVKNDLESTSVKIEPIIQSLFNKFLISENGVEEDLKIGQIGQGYQRIFVASILKSYVDLYKEYGPKEEDDKKETLILFEEPEIFLHPELKRSINKSIKDIVDVDKNIVVIISTHDPYFLYSNLNDRNIKIYSFEKKNNETQPPKEGITDFGQIADEILHISLFNKVLVKMIRKDLGAPEFLKTSEEMINLLDDDLLKKEIRVYKDRSGEYPLLLPIY